MMPAPNLNTNKRYSRSGSVACPQNVSQWTSYADVHAVRFVFLFLLPD
jgi:hypothetical protein